jgi:hypothetical protein
VTESVLILVRVVVRLAVPQKPSHPCASVL